MKNLLAFCDPACLSEASGEYILWDVAHRFEPGQKRIGIALSSLPGLPLSYRFKHGSHSFPS